VSYVLSLSIYMAIGAFLAGLYAGAMNGTAETGDKVMIAVGWFFAIFYGLGYKTGKKTPIAEPEKT